jgi:hypothetical protein
MAVRTGAEQLGGFEWRCDAGSTTAEAQRRVTAFGPNIVGDQATPPWQALIVADEPTA